MRIQCPFLEVVLTSLLLPWCTTVTRGQQPSQQDPPTLSPPLHAALYPEVMCVHCVVPSWDHSYLLHVEIDRGPAVVTMYDKTGKKVVEGRMWPADAAKVSVRSAGATQAGGIVAVGGGIMTDGSTQRFIAKTDVTGRTVQSIRTESFSACQVCEATDGTVWALGYGFDSADLQDTDKNVLRHYSFDKGLLGSFVSLDSISKSRDAILQISAPGKSFLRCSKDRVSVLFWPSAQYIQADGSTEKFTRWQVVAPGAVGEKATGFAVTQEGKIFVSLTDFSEADKTRTNGLYELQATPGPSVAILVPVRGAHISYDPNGIAPDGAFFRLWGADGNELVVQRQGDGWGLSWARVSASSTTPD